jgi:3D (Asp-Asp-Asp) domain-containing protein
MKLNKFDQETFGLLGAVAATALLGWLTSLLCSCAPLPPSTPKTTKARVTVYDRFEDKFGSRIAIGGRAREGTTAAAPATIPFGTQVNVPALAGVVGTGHFNVQDRGSALEKAYRHGELRLDIYVASRAKLRRLSHTLPEFMEVSFQ